MREFFGFGGYQRTPEGYMSWQHLLFVTLLILTAVFLAIFLGRKNRHRPLEERNKVLVVAAIAIDAFELFKIVLLCFREHNPMHWLTNLPLFLCSIQLIALPLAAFSKGRIKEAALDFVSIFGVLGMVLCRHKTKHWYFRLFFPLFLAVQIAILAVAAYFYFR